MPCIACCPVWCHALRSLISSAAFMKDLLFLYPWCDKSSAPAASLWAATVECGFVWPLSLYASWTELGTPCNSLQSDAFWLLFRTSILRHPSHADFEW